ncbi:Release factor glutamine methyltransferase [Aquimixticola soesokkakensis]|uniref:Release factor glutamine methyltransferase n=1 Tax=Aquimixticola soesokkakensis TaxID=1519096 RepID=A0A1Y5TIM1_9RHOB|nr:peptide chain release factor N(5)-glutamine methyltransferase [Aquimixticola soesokkakensis]SLN64988.1 Release factor glutamine methyltransferase [Aquimixticola soesokkakensis]
MSAAVTVQQALIAGKSRLDAAGLAGAMGDARRLMAFALKIDASRLTLVAPDLLPPEAQIRFEAAIAARLTRQPVSQIIGKRAFYGREFRVTPDTLDPRPDTEALISAALRAPATRLLDLGTGTGCILLTLLAELPQASGVGADVSAAALTVAQSNAQALGLGARAAFLWSDWFSQIAGRFDLITANPPYIALCEMAGLAPELAHEPRMALTDESDGLTAYRAICARVRDYLAPEGRLLVEIGPTQGTAVSQLMRDAGLVAVEILPDLDGRDRVVAAHAPKTASQTAP